MLFYTHLLLGVFFFLLVDPFLSPARELVFFLMVLLGSVFPDIDEPHSKMNRWSGILGRVVGVLFIHRGVIHSFLFMGLMCALVWHFWAGFAALGLLLGYVAHLFGDALTPMGVAVLYPFSNFRVRGPIRTGGLVEVLLMVLIIVLVVRKTI